MSANERFERMLAAYHDGELGPVRRWWIERRLRRDPAAQRELAELASLGESLRAADGGAPPAPDVWDEVRRRLPARTPAGAASPLAERAPADAASSGWLRPTLPWAAAGAALAAAAATALLFVGTPGLDERAGAPLAGEGAVRWLDSRGQPMMVLQDDREATVIWVRDDDERVSGRGGLHGVG